MIISYFKDIDWSKLYSLISNGNTLALAAVIVIIIFLLLFLIDYTLSHSLIGRFYRIFVVPGIILHELSHAFLCLLTGAKIKSISLFDKDGGRVVHSDSKIPVLGQFLISLSPFAIGIVAIYYLAHYIGFAFPKNGIDNISTASLFSIIKGQLASFDLHSRLDWLALYLIFSVSATMRPSRQDFKNIALTLVVLGIIFILSLRFTGLLEKMSNLQAENIVIFLLTVGLLLILALILSSIVYIISKVFHLS